MQTEGQGWVLFAYSVPSEPSTRRVALWRKLRGLGALYIQQSVCVVPDTAHFRSGLEGCKALAEDAAGAVWMIAFTPSDEAGAARLLRDFQAIRSAEYAEFGERAEALLAELVRETAGAKFTFAELEEDEDEVEKLAKWLARIAKRDALDCVDGTRARSLMAECSAAIERFRATTLSVEAGVETSVEPEAS